MTTPYPIPAQIPSRPRATLQLLLTLWFAFYSTFALLSPPLLDDADSVHAEVAREMLLRHDPVTLYANGIRYLEKAPVLYWSMAASMRFLGVHTATARLPLALFVLALLLLTEKFAREAFGSARVGLYAAMVLLSSFGIFIFTRILIPDAIVCLWLVAALFCFWRTENSPPERTGDAPILPCLGFGAACALNILTKGLIGLVFPLGTVLLYLLLTRGTRATAKRLQQLHPLATAFVFLLLSAPWHIAIARANPDVGHPRGLTHTGRLLPFFWKNWSVPEPTLGNVHGWTWFYFVNEHLLRYLNLRVPRDYDTVPLALFWGLLLIWLMPWSAFLFKALGTVPWRSTLRSATLRSRTVARLFAYNVNDLTLQDTHLLTSRQKILLLLGIAALLPLLFFSFSTRQEYYVLPAMPFLAMLIAHWLDREADEAEGMRTPAPLHRSGMRIALTLLILGSLAALACGILILHSRAPVGDVDLSTLLQQNPGDYALSFGHFLDLNAQAMALFQLPLAIAGGSLFAGTAAAWWARSDFRPHLANMLLLGTAMAFLLAAHVGLTTFSPVLTSKKLADAIRPQLQPDDLIVLNGEYEAGSSLGFYLRRNDIHILHGHSANLWYGSFFTDAPHLFDTDGEFRLRWASPRRIFLWTTPGKLPPLPTKPFLIAEIGGKQILSNQPNHN